MEEEVSSAELARLSTLWPIPWMERVSSSTEEQAESSESASFLAPRVIFLEFVEMLSAMIERVFVALTIFFNTVFRWVAMF